MRSPRELLCHGARDANCLVVRATYATLHPVRNILAETSGGTALPLRTLPMSNVVTRFVTDAIVVLTATRNDD